MITPDLVVPTLHQQKFEYASLAPVPLGLPIGKKQVRMLARDIKVK